MAGTAQYQRRSKRGEPVWEMATFYPTQGNWSEEQYLALDTNHLIEFHNGVLEFLPMPSFLHQRIVRLLLRLLEAWAAKHGGEPATAPMPLKTAQAQYREPDLMYLRDPVADAGGVRRIETAELVMEVVSEGEENRKRDYVDKRKDYAKAGIPECWIVDPQVKLITVLSLKDGEYVEHSKACAGQTATSALLEGFAVNASELFGK
jgi:Uma2 family endonuclease